MEDLEKKVGGVLPKGSEPSALGGKRPVPGTAWKDGKQLPLG